jgi:hypothetical protein
VFFIPLFFTVIRALTERRAVPATGAVPALDMAEGD